MSKKTATQDAIRAALALVPDGMTYEEIAHLIGKSESAVSASILHARKKTGSDLFRVTRYERVRGKGGRPHPVYALGPGKDAPNPKRITTEDRRETQARYRRKHAARLRTMFRIRRAKARGQEAANTNPFADLLRA